MKILALTGGVGGAKLALGLSQCLAPDEVDFVVNTGDDFKHLGFHISPDIDTLTYTLGNVSNPETGWGRDDETWNFMESLEALGGDTWFKIGDRDLALHVFRQQQLESGKTLTEITKIITNQLGIKSRVLPVSNDPVPTIVETTEGPLPFQHYFVRDRCKPVVTGFQFSRVDKAKLNPEIDFETTDAVVICPSNPFVSVDPMLAIPGMRSALHAFKGPIVAVSPIIGGAAIKGPTAKMMKELKIPTTTVEVAKHYIGLINGFVIDQQDHSHREAVKQLGLTTDVQQTVMVTLEDRIQLAKAVLDLIRNIR